MTLDACAQLCLCVKFYLGHPYQGLRLRLCRLKQRNDVKYI